MSERNYKAEYKKFQSSTKAKKYRAELNQYNRKKGTYGNGDGKDASHKGGRIAGFEAESKNRGRAEKSRLKKENVAMFEAKFTDATLAPRIQHWASKHKGTGIGYGHVLAHLAVHMKEMGWEKSYRAVAKVAKELGKKRKVESITEGAKMIDLVRLYNQALKLTPGSASQKKVKREINRLVKVLKVQMKEGGPGSGRPKDTTAGDPDDAWDDEEGRAKPKGKTDADAWDDDEEAKAQAFKDMEDEFGDLEEGTKAFLAYREMKEALNVAIYGIKKMRKFIDDAPYNPKFNMITKELYKWEIDLEKKWRRVVPQISKISKDKMLEAAPMGRASVVGLSVNKDLVIPKNQMSKAKSQYKKMMNHLMKAGKSMTQPGEIDMMVSHMESAYDEMLALWKNVKEVKKESINEAGVDWKIKNKKVDAVLKGIIRSMGLKTVKDFGMGQSGISFFIDDEKEAKKLHKLLTKQMKNVRIINLDKSKGDVSNHVVYSRMFESEQVDEGFGSPELMKKKDLAEFEKTRQKNAEVLGYKLTGRPDHNHERKISVELENAKHTKKSKKTG